jgi:hypothetical protein
MFVLIFFQLTLKSNLKEEMSIHFQIVVLFFKMPFYFQNLKGFASVVFPFSKIQK